MTGLILNLRLRRAREKIIVALETGAPGPRITELRSRAYEAWQDLQKLSQVKAADAGRAL